MIHLVKLCVGAESVEDHEKWVQKRLAYMKASGLTPEQYHTTRMFPKRKAELLDGGSLYWVIKGSIACRQEITDLRQVAGEDGINRCQIILDPKLIRTQLQGKRPFQGWRYLKAEDAPSDIRPGEDTIPEELHKELSELGLL